MRKAGSFAEQVTQQPTPEQLEKLRQLKRATAPANSAIYVIDMATGERQKIDLNSRDIINKLADLDRTDPNALIVVQTPSKRLLIDLKKQ